MSRVQSLIIDFYDLKIHLKHENVNHSLSNTLFDLWRESATLIQGESIEHEAVVELERFSFVESLEGSLDKYLKC